MKSYVALLDGGKREVSVEVAQRGPGLYEVRIGDEVHLVDAFKHDYGTLSLLVDTQSYTATLDERGPTKVHVRVRDSVFPLELLDERKLRMRRAAGRFTVEGRQVLLAPMPGRIVKVATKVGESVTRGQPLVVIDAMKMENELKSPKDGRVVELFVREGQTVEGNAKLCAVE
jgi:biotin carboxyl carrier protein